MAKKTRTRSREPPAWLLVLVLVAAVAGQDAIITESRVLRGTVVEVGSEYLRIRTGSGSVRLVAINSIKRVEVAKAEELEQVKEMLANTDIEVVPAPPKQEPAPVTVPKEELALPSAGVADSILASRAELEYEERTNKKRRAWGIVGVSGLAALSATSFGLAYKASEDGYPDAALGCGLFGCISAAGTGVGILSLGRAQIGGFERARTRMLRELENPDRLDAARELAAMRTLKSMHYRARRTKYIVAGTVVVFSVVFAAIAPMKDHYVSSAPPYLRSRPSPYNYVVSLVTLASGAVTLALGTPQEAAYRDYVRLPDAGRDRKAQDTPNESDE